MSSRNDWRGRGERRDGRRRPPRDESQDDKRPLPPEVYQRRRVAAVAVLLLVVALLIWAAVSCSGPKEEDPAPAASSQTNSWQAPTPKNTEESSKDEDTDKASKDSEPKDDKDAAADADKDGKDTDAKKSEDRKDSKGKDACELSDLEVIAQTDQSSYADDQQPRFFMTVRNDSGADCEIDVDRSPLRFEVYDMANNARMWSDIDCNEPMVKGKTDFPDGEDRHFEAVWSRTTSGPNECAVRHPVGQGSYYLHAVLGNNPSAAQPFNITG